MQLIVGISDMKVSNSREDLIVTYSLGSCVGLALYDHKACVGGMVHCMLPLSKIEPNKAQANPCMFTDTGVPALLTALYDLGAEKKNLVAKVAGAANLLDERGTFRIGERNFIILRKVLWKNNILIAAEDTGGTVARTLSLNMGDGRVQVKSKGQTYDLE